MKIQPLNISNNKENINKTGFKGATDSLINFWAAIDRGGLAASFTLQDMLGTNFPRTGVSLCRGKELNGKWNWKAAIETGIREFTTGPSMFAVPAGVLYLFKKFSGTTSNIPTESIKDLTDIMSKTVLKGETTVKDLKRNFYTNALKQTFENTFEDAKGVNIGKYADLLLDYKNAKAKPLFLKILNKDFIADGKRVITKQDILEDLTGLFIADKKKYTKNYGDFLNVKIAKNSGEIDFVSLQSYLQDYCDDFQKTITKKGRELSSLTSEFFEKFKKIKVGTRVTTNILMAVATALFMLYIPKLYTMFRDNPEIKPTYDKAKELRGEKWA